MRPRAAGLGHVTSGMPVADSNAGQGWPEAGHRRG